MDVSFTTRLSNVMALTSALGQSVTNLALADMQGQAKEIEARIYGQAASKVVYSDDYNAACAKEIEALEQQSILLDNEPNEPAENGLNPNAPDLGPYKNATFFKDGLFSTIFKAASSGPVDDSGKQHSDLVALKVTTPSAMTAPHNSERETRILNDVKCEQIIPLLSTLWQPGGRLVLVFPFMPIDLETLMKTSTIQQIQARHIIRDIFDGLSHVHSLNIIHRDVKPSNILLRSKHGPAYLADFGIAWSPNDSASEPAQQKITDVGTTSYRPPELLFGYAAYDTSLDLWAAGCTVAEMLHPSHHRLFDAGDLGSELALIRSIFTTLGTPDDELWPSARLFPDWGKMRFVDHPAKPWDLILDEAPNSAIDFVSQLVQYEGSQRMTATQALEHAFLKDIS